MATHLSRVLLPALAAPPTIPEPGVTLLYGRTTGRVCAATADIVDAPLLGVLARLDAPVATSATAATDLTGLALPVQAGGTYLLRWVLGYQTGTTGAVIRVAVNGPAASAVWIQVETITSRAAFPSTRRAQTLTAYNTLTAAPTTTPAVGAVCPVMITARVAATASGTVRPRFASSVSGSTITVAAGSYGIARWTP
ncbi:hypothetical protein [Planomonospora algeriensis]